MKQPEIIERLMAIMSKTHAPHCDRNYQGCPMEEVLATLEECLAHERDILKGSEAIALREADEMKRQRDFLQETIIKALRR